MNSCSWESFRKKFYTLNDFKVFVLFGLAFLGILCCVTLFHLNESGWVFSWPLFLFVEVPLYAFVIWTLYVSYEAWIKTKTIYEPELLRSNKNLAYMTCVRAIENSKNMDQLKIAYDIFIEFRRMYADSDYSNKLMEKYFERKYELEKQVK